ncbi:MAG: hypothetical protein AAF943_07460 [Pseudomonadota bacterium]
MTRSVLMTTSTIAALIAAPMAFATEATTLDMGGNSPAITNGGDTSIAGSSEPGRLPTAKPGIGVSTFEPTPSPLPQAEYDALMASVGSDFKTNEGTILGVVTDVTMDAQGHPEMVVDLRDDTKIDADVLVVTLLPESVQLRDGKIFLDTSEDELYNKAQAGAARDDETRTAVIVM